MSGGLITGNSTENNGGGVFIRGGSFTMSGGTISDNQAKGRYVRGGGVYFSGGTFTMTGGSITGNSAAYYGGGVYANGYEFSLSGSSEINNNND